MEHDHLVIIYATFFAASLVKGLTGMGFATLCLPVLTSFIDIRIAIPIVIIPSLLSNLFVIARAQKFKYSFNRFWLLYLSAIPGLYVGVKIMSVSGNNIGRIVLGGASIAYALIALFNLAGKISKKTERTLNFPIGITSGLINGLTGSQVMPILPYLLSLRIDMDTLISTINTAFTFSSILMLILLQRVDLLSFEIIRISLIGIIPVAAGILIGNYLRRYVPDEKLKTAVLIVLMIMGLNLIVSP